MRRASRERYEEEVGYGVGEDDGENNWGETAKAGNGTLAANIRAVEDTSVSRRAQNPSRRVIIALIPSTQSVFYLARDIFQLEV